MKSYRKVLEMNVPARRGFVNITPPVSYTHLDVYKRQVIHGGECKGDNLRYTNLPIMEKG